MGLGEAESANPFAAGQFGQVLHLLLFGAGLQDGGAAKAGVGGQDDTRGGTHARELLNGHAVHDIGAAGTAVLRGDRNTHQTNLGHLFDRLHGETFLFVNLCGQRFHLFLCKLANHLQEELFLFCETKIHSLRVLCLNSPTRPNIQTFMTFILLQSSQFPPAHPWAGLSRRRRHGRGNRCCSTWRRPRSWV